MAQQQATMVAVRLRPPSSKETGMRCIKADEGDGGDARNVQFTSPVDKSLSQYSYDRVFGEDKTQADVFEHCRHIVTSVLNGTNGTVMAYGQTGSGKTHTLIGTIDGEERGLVPRAVQALGQGIEADTSGAEFEVRLSVVEIYCERIRDLLDPSGGTRGDNLQVKQDAAGAIFIEGAVEAQVCGEQQLVAIMHQGLAARTVAATCMNAISSRSHCIVTVTVEKTCPDGTVLVGKLKLVDLAGSERQDKTMAAGQTLVEGSLINKSLSTLANVIYALTDTSGTGGSSSSSGSGGGSGSGSGSQGGGEACVSNNKHVPFRDSKLTRVLQDSLGGSSRTMLIICCSPCWENGPETLSSLRFGSRARGLKNTVAVNVRLSPEVLQQQLEKARAQIKELQQQLAAEQQQQRNSSPGRTSSDPSSHLQEYASALGSLTTTTTATHSNHDSSLSGTSALQPEGASAAAAAAKQAKVCGGSWSSTSSKSMLLLNAHMPWWQHVVIAGLTAATVGAYVHWESTLMMAGGGC